MLPNPLNVLIYLHDLIKSCKLLRQAVKQTFGNILTSLTLQAKNDICLVFVTSVDMLQLLFSKWNVKNELV